VSKIEKKEGQLRLNLKIAKVYIYESLIIESEDKE